MNKNLILGIIVIVVIGAIVFFVTTQQAPQPVPETPATETPVTGTSTDETTGTTTSSTPNNPGTPSGVQIYTLVDVSAHSDRSSCWSVVNGNVYNLTTWIDKHPGGAQNILKICGKDGTSAFTGKHAGQERPETMLASFLIGKLQ